MPMIPLSWLADHVQIHEGTDAAKLASDLVRVGLEEEEIHPAKVQGPLVVGRILTRVEEAHSNGKTVNYCRVDVGEYNCEPGTGKEPSDIPSRGIICGAHNFDVGDLVVVSLPGAILPGPFPIAGRKTYGHFSDGMICSSRELGIGDEHDGIIVLPKFFPDRDIPAPGSDLITFLGLGEEILEINVTPDRGYCFSMRGVAREYSHSTGAVFVDPGLCHGKQDMPLAPDEAGFPVKVEDSSPIRGNIGCDRFVTRIVTGVNPLASTPQWMCDRLEMAGMHSISLPVDITNYVMLDLGQPMHAYDMSAIAAPFVVRRAKGRDDKLVTLDGVERVFSSEDLLITDSPEGLGSRVLALAGVMGGKESEVTSSTRNILLEAAHFDAISIARTARRHRIPSEASKRFERGTDPQLPAVAAQRAVDLLVEYGGGTANEGSFDLNNVRPISPIRMHIGESQRLTGVDYAPSRIRELLQLVGCAIEGEDTDEIWAVTPPSWRPDLTMPADLVEEVARLDGYDEIPSILPAARPGHGLTAAQKARRFVSATLAHAGLTEVESYPFMSDSHDRQKIATNDPRRQALRLRNPLANDAPLLRTSILDTLLDVAARNVARGAASVAVFETGTIARPDGVIPCNLPSAESRPNKENLKALADGVPTQPWHIGGVCTGEVSPVTCLTNPRKVDWADAVEYVREVSRVLGVRVEVTRAWLPEKPIKHAGPRLPEPATNPEDVAPWHPGRVARIFVRQGRDLIDIACAGELHPAVTKAFGLPSRSIAFEIDLEQLIAQMSDDALQVKPVSTFPLAKEDIALVVPVDLPAARVEQVIRSAIGALAENVTLFDIYEGDQVKEGYRSMTFSLRIRAVDKTLTADEVAQVRSTVISKCSKQLGAELRS